jgi:hypothetical protein
MRVYQVLCNTDEPDSNLGTTSQPQLQSCVDSCGNVTGCIGVSYTATSGSCSYKSNVSNRVGSSTADSAILADYVCPGADSTRLVDSSGSVYEILCNTFFPLSSNITSNLATSDLASCSKMCSDTNHCTGFTFQNGSCTLVSNRNSGDGVLRMNVATAILMAKRVAQVVSSGIAPYRSTSLVRSLPADVSRTPSSTIQISPATSITPTSTISMTDETSTVGISSMTLSSPSASSDISLTIASTIIDLADVITTETHYVVTMTSSQGQISVPSLVSSMEQAEAGTPTIPGSSISTPATVSISSTSMDSDTSSSIQSLATDSVSVIISSSSQTLTALLTPTLASGSQSSSLPAASRTFAPTNTALLASTLSSITSSDGSGVLGSTLVTSETSFVIAPASSRAVSSSFSYTADIDSSTLDTASSSVLRTVSYFPVSSGLPPQTSYSCPAVDGEVVQANTGGYYMISCDDETTG